ncbi:MAG: ABC transporter ATP-binding protein [Alphaproteobacteria bacterium]
MKLGKLILYAVTGLLLTIGISSFLWYGYPSPKLSFFLSGKGEIRFDIDYTDISGNEKNTQLYPELSDTPVLYTVVLKSADVNTLKFKLGKYTGIVNISDVFLNGKAIKDLKPDFSDGLNIINSSSGNLSVSVQNDTTIDVCSDCYKPTHRVFKPIVFTTAVLFGIILCGLFIAGHIFSQKIKEKLLTLYTLKNYALILPYAKPYWGRALLAVLITIPVGSMDAVIAWSLKPFMDVVLVEKQSGWTMYIPLMIVIFSVLQALFTYIATYMNTWVGNKMSLDLKHDLFNKLLRSDAAFFDKANSGEVLFRFNHDAESACGGLLNNMKLFTTRLFSSLSLIIVLFYNSWQLAIVAVVVLFGALFPLTRVRKRLKKTVSKDNKAMMTLLTNYNEAFSGNRIITAYNLYDYCKAKFTNSVEAVFNLGLTIVRKTGVIAPVMHFISSFGIAFVIWFGSYLIVSHQITVGNFASFVTSLVMLYNPIKSIGNNYNNVILSLMAVDRVFAKLRAIPNIRNNDIAHKVERLSGNIEYKDVCFAYTKDKPVLQNINLSVKSGQTIALVGNSGGGKTTISTLLPRFYDITSGAIEIDGINVKDYDIDCLRDNIAIVFQDNFLFGGTIRDNILLGRTDISDERLQQVIRSACLDEFIASLEKGLDTTVGERGVMLSGGQKQRIAIARAFIKNAPILILDEATSALDNKSEAVVQQALDNLMKDRTVLVIAHRLSTVRHADCIVVLNNGHIVERGTHDELLKKEGEYAALYKTQLS